MLIPITFNAPSSSTPKLPPSLAKISHDEVVLIELQGALEIESSHPNERDGKLIGTLTIDQDLKRPTLRIGHHLIEGKLANLPKPLAVLHRSQKQTRLSASQWTGEGDSNMPGEDTTMDGRKDDGADDELGLNSESIVQWNAIAIVKRKIVFSKRPTPIVEGQAKLH
ncbi:hypothetical protein BT96DRAFT_916365 [Gymnopus androsaceus JB14]|uniref:Ctf8-domain-containing protein n=1 Tax=Gymnopus androsaceus JB14 TaxID=1447944 RepID=A0A6A4I8R2_9AGAR|nr:hypothetical protein BT96DRAFT_916365 [Gymnopus androsaceus JB14]